MNRYSGFILFALACSLAAAIPFVLPLENSSGAGAVFPGWPKLFEGCPIRETELSSRERDYNRVFPGRMGRFTDGARSIVLRWVTAPTHRVHSGAVCLQAAGGYMKPRDLWRDKNGILWSVWDLEGDAGPVRVRERCYDGQGKSWPDVSSWFWAAVLGKTEGPWWVVTVAERFNSNSPSHGP